MWQSDVTDWRDWLTWLTDVTDWLWLTDCDWLTDMTDWCDWLTWLTAWLTLLTDWLTWLTGVTWCDWHDWLTWLTDMTDWLNDWLTDVTDWRDRLTWQTDVTDWRDWGDWLTDWLMKRSWDASLKPDFRSKFELLPHPPSTPQTRIFSNIPHMQLRNTYHDLTSCIKSKKSNVAVLRYLSETWFSVQFWPFDPHTPQTRIFRNIWYMQLRSTYYGLTSCTKSKKSNEAFLRYFPKAQFSGWFSVQFWPFDPPYSPNKNFR